jgi:antitoxin (DNA-binding transcriptional repressor) of toxin-antitoxin stability system
MTKTVSAAEFEQNCHALIDAVVDKGDEVLVERDGKIVAKLVPSRDHDRDRGPMYGTVVFEGDIISPVTDPEDWDAMK